MLQIKAVESRAVSLLNKIISSENPSKSDFIQFSDFLKLFTLNQIIEAYFEKYPSGMMKISVPVIILDFRQADENEDPISLKGQTWESVKKVIQKHVADYLK